MPTITCLNCGVEQEELFRGPLTCQRCHHAKFMVRSKKETNKVKEQNEPINPTPTASESVELSKNSEILKKMLERLRKAAVMYRTRELSEAITQLEYASWRYDNFLIEKGVTKV